MSTKKANLILTTCSMAWGTSYIFMKLGIEGLSPLMLIDGSAYGNRISDSGTYIFQKITER